ncbi:TIR domain-containing protein [Duganella sp. HH105]|uniref:TIR domain-containing protein n=1 Tax=Duganella sp. HH105 TaxID=1781067 RepID=UPI000877CC7C|nr:nucleotide-binding protein [Duganella sp. HH105]OEZ54227.1 putative nucleotide-binding protein containing TIR-like domain protein [Duganella sp. HH105]
MYNLFVRSSEDWVNGVMMMPKDRFLQYTDDYVTEQVGSLSRKTLDELTKFPALFMSEMPTQTAAQVAWIRKIKDQGAELRIEFNPDDVLVRLAAEELKDLFLELDIRKSEIRTTHWAVKDLDLLQVLQKKQLWRGAPVNPAEAKFSRRTIVSACILLERLLGTHARLTRFLQEIGMEHSPAGQKKGGLEVRLTDLSGYVIACPDEETAAGYPLAYTVIARAADLDQAAIENEFMPDRGRQDRQEFLKNLTKDGYAFFESVLYTSALATSIQPLPINLATPVEARESSQAKVPVQVLSRSTDMSEKPKVFIVHGRDNSAKSEVARFIERIGLEAIILHEQANAGRTLITKFQDVAQDVAFAIVLMTPDDEGALKGNSPNPRARQNVVFELGFFLGKMPAGHVCALVKEPIEKPSDFDGVAYIELDDHEGWKTRLARELTAAKIPFLEKKVFN